MSVSTGNYLRVRGEYDAQPEGVIEAYELPPRARRIQVRSPRRATIPGTTSACAENTAYRVGSP